MARRLHDWQEFLVKEQRTIQDFEIARTRFVEDTNDKLTQLAADWKHPYSREEAAYPLDGDHRGKYWPPVRRIDQAYGDRNLVCACPPVEVFQD